MIMECILHFYTVFNWVKRSQSMFKKVPLIMFAMLFVCVLIQAQTKADTRSIDTFPYTKIFDGVTPPALPDGWTVEDTNNDNITWGTRYLNTYSEPNAMACDYNDYIDMDDWFFSPPLLLEGSTSYRITFSYKCEDSDFPERLEVKWGYGNSSLDMGTQVLFSNSNVYNESFQQVSTLLITPSDNKNDRTDYYIGWHGFSLAYEWTLWVDDITIEEIPQEPRFSVTPSSYDFGLHQVGLSSTDNTFSVTNTGMGFMFIDDCYLVGTDVSDFVLSDTTSYPVSITDTDNISVSVRFYPHTTGTKNVFLRFVENGTIFHDIPITGSANDYTIASFPYNQNFESAVLPTNWISLADGAGWRFGANLGRGTFPIPTHTYYAAVNKNTSIFEYDTKPGRNDFLIPPPFNLTTGVGIPHLTFYCYYTMLGGEHATVEGSTDGANWITLYEIPAYTSGWKFTDINLEAYAGCSRFFIRFHADDMGNLTATGWAIDDMNVLFVDPTPLPPTNVRVSIVSGHVHVSWDPVLYVTGYRVYSAPEPNTDLWTIETSEPITATSWDGNLSLFAKFFKIKSVR